MRHVFLIGCVLTLLLSAEMRPAVHNPNETSPFNKIPVEIRTDQAELSPGDTFSVGVNLNRPIRMKGVDVNISYDPHLLHCLSGSQHRFEAKRKCGTYTVNPKKGILTYREENKASSTSDPSGTICSFRFLAIRPGQANFVWRCFGATLEKDLGRGVPFLLTAASVVISEKIETGPDLLLPDHFDLSQNYPNPFNPETRLSYQLPEPRHVRLTVFNILGQEVRTLVNGEQAAGFYTVIWDGKDNRGYDVSSGTYFCRMEVGDFRKSQRMTLLR